ncbi:MAG: response regulator transcription factor [Bdellovibrionales bacterium]|nr:response regulator transcription factor [Bdellovibrionales bacterium]
MAKVLIVEDSTSQALIIQEIVQEAGHEGILCPDLRKGMAQILTAIKPDLVLLDLVLLGPDGKPVQDGFQMCREVKRVSANQTPVVIVSSKSDEDSQQWAKLQGADAFLKKPFVVEELVSVIESLLNVR